MHQIGAVSLWTVYWKVCRAAAEPNQTVCQLTKFSRIEAAPTQLVCQSTDE
jgi:hypothetical protein